MQTLMETAPARSQLRRWPWALAAVLLLGAAIATARATYLFWLPCRGSMTRGLVFAGQSEGPIPDACLAQMDSGTPFPYAADDAVYPTEGPELAAMAMALAGLAWLVVVLGMRWRLRTTVVAVLPALLSLGLAVSSARAVLLGGTRESAFASTPWWYLLEAFAVCALLVIWLWQREARGWQLARLTLILWGVTAFGMQHALVDYMIMVAINTWNWDCPPGCGYPTVVAIAVAAALTASGMLQRRPLH